MVKKVYKMEELDCAHCAAKMEAAIGKLPGVEKASVSFISQKLTLEADEDKLPAILEQADQICRSFEPDCRIRF